MNYTDYRNGRGGVSESWYQFQTSGGSSCAENFSSECLGMKEIVREGVSSGAHWELFYSLMCIWRGESTWERLFYLLFLETGRNFFFLKVQFSLCFSGEFLYRFKCDVFEKHIIIAGMHLALRNNLAYCIAVFSLDKVLVCRQGKRNNPPVLWVRLELSRNL